MHHVAIMNKKFLRKVLCGEKTIESRWSKHRINPFGAVAVGDDIFFKLTGGKVMARAKICGVRYFERKDQETAIDDFIINHSNALGLESEGIARDFIFNNKKKNYLTLIDLDEICQIESFDICKDGFGIRSGWIVIDDIRRLIKNKLDNK